jgi:PhzF family phenazine biosynthesis protein
MASRGWTTVNLVWREDAETFHARNPFPPGGVVEDPATGAAAAALGAYLAVCDALPAQRAFTIHQGEDMGRPSRLTVSVPQDLSEGIRVSGTAVKI